MVEFRKLKLRKRIVFAIGVFLGFLILVGMLNYTIYQYYSTKSSIFFNAATEVSKAEHNILYHYSSLNTNYELAFDNRGEFDAVRNSEYELSQLLNGFRSFEVIESEDVDSLVQLVKNYTTEADSALLLLNRGDMQLAREYFFNAKITYGNNFVNVLARIVQQSHSHYAEALDAAELRRKQLIILIILALIGLFGASIIVYRYYMQNISQLIHTGELQKDVQRLSMLLSQRLLNQQDTLLYDMALLNFLVDHTETDEAIIYTIDPDTNSVKIRSKSQINAEGIFASNKDRINQDELFLSNIKEISYFDTSKKQFKVATRSNADKILIPILQHGEVVLIIALAFSKSVSERTERFLNEMWAMLMVGYVRVATYEKVKRFGEKVDDQNKELEQKTKELILQSEELKESNIDLQMQKMQLDEANQMKTRFLSNMSHELRTPLNSIIALTGVLSRKLNSVINEKDTNYLDVILRNGKHLLSLINEVLDLARIEAGAMEINREEFSMENLLEAVIETVDHLIVNKDIQLKKTFLNGDVVMFSDRPKCYHILQNIISNAVKFTDKGSIDIAVEYDNYFCHIRIKDTGVGIPEENLPHIFDEFHQVFGAKDEYEGTGLGLSIAYKYCKLLSGEISVDSVLDEGAEFRIKLPLCEKHINDKTQSYTRTWFGEAKSVLLVELEAGESKQIKNKLDQLKIPVVVARTREKAFEILRSIVPECIILVGQNSKSNEIELLSQLRLSNDSGLIPILLLTDNDYCDSELSELKSRKNAFVISHASVLSGGLKSAMDRLLYSESSSIEKQVQRSTLKSRDNKGRVLIIEDNKESLQLMESSLTSNHIVYTASDGLLGAEKARLLSPDIILMDISLPGKDGIVLMKELKHEKNTANIPIIALTTKVLRDEREELIGYGFDDYIAKPINNNLLNTAINNWLYGE